MTTPTPEPRPTPPGFDTEAPFAFIYSPDGQEPQQWEFDPNDWTVGEMKTVERIYGKPRDEFLADVNNEWVDARALLLWIVRRRKEPDLPLTAVDDLKTSHLHLVQLVRPDDDETLEDDDPEPDGVNDPKAGKPGGNAGSPAKPKPKPKPTAG